MRYIVKSALVMLALAACISTARASVIVNGFDGDYAVSNWTQSLDGGSIDTSGAPDYISLTSSNAGGGASAQDFTIVALADGLVSFSWLFETADSDGPSFDPFGWLLNGVFTQLTGDGGADIQSGSDSFLVTAGDVFGFRAASDDSIFGAATTVVSDFSAPSVDDVPEPTVIALLGLGLALVGFAVRRRRQA